MERVKLLEAVGGPLDFIPNPPHQVGQPKFAGDYGPMSSTTLLIEFSGSDLWRDHLRRSNFASCEVTVSTEGRMLAFERMLDYVIKVRTEPPDSPTKFVSAPRLPEELDYWNTADVVIVWVWTNGFADATGHGADARRLNSIESLGWNTRESYKGVSNDDSRNVSCLGVQSG